MAFSEFRDADGRPLDKAGSVTIKAKDGRPGEKGGDITVHVAGLDTGGTATMRFICDGTAGERGETGGLLKFVGRKDGPPTKNVNPLSIEDITTAVNDSGHSTRDINGISYWYYPGDQGKTTDLYTGLRGRNIFNQGQVTDLRLHLYFQPFLKTVRNVVHIPQGNVDSYDETGGDSIHITCDGETGRWLPSNGENAYPSGKSGQGGDGGNLTGPAALLGAVYRGKSPYTPPSDFVAGGRAGTPNPSYYVQALISQRTWYDKTAIVYCAHSTQDGNDAQGSTQGAGADGKLLPGDPSLWLDPRLLRNVTCYARRAFGCGDRAGAWQIIQPYWQMFGNPELQLPHLSPEAEGARRVIQSLVSNLARNLDLYGNPPGWVPRFSADTYLQIYLADRRFSYRFCGVMEKAVGLMESIEHAHDLLNVVAAQSERVLTATQQELGSAFRSYDGARDTLDTVRSTLAQVEAALDAINKKATDEAVIAEQDQALVAGCFNIAGTILQAIPVYQPALGAVGTIVQGIGGVVAPDPAAEPLKASDYVAKIASSAASALNDNADTFKSQLDTTLRDKYKGVLDPDKDDLDATIKKLKGQIAEQQAAVDGAASKAYDKAAKDPELAKLLTTTDAKAASENAANPDDLRRRIDEHNKLILDLNDIQGDPTTLAGELAARKRQNLIAAKGKLQAQLADVQLQTADKAKRTAAQSKLNELTTKLSALTVDKNKADVEAGIKTVNETFGSALDGAQKFVNGTAQVASTISSMMTKPKADDPKVVAVRDKLLNSRFKTEYEAQLAKVEEAKKQMATAVATLQTANQKIASTTADLADALRATIDVGRNRQALAIGIDPGLKASLLAMQVQATERMDYYLYLFRKAYMYEYCRALPEGVANVNVLVANLDKWLHDSNAALAADIAKGGDAAKAALMTATSAMKDDDLTQAATAAMKNTLADFARDIMQRRQQSGPQADNQYALDVDHLEQFTTQHSVFIPDVARAINRATASPAPGAADFLHDNSMIRVSGIEIKSDDFKFKRLPNSDRASIRLEVIFGRDFILRASVPKDPQIPDGPSDVKYFRFRIAEADVPIKYGFVVSGFTDQNGVSTGTIKPDHTLSVDTIFKTIMTEVSDKETTYKDMCPSVFSSMRITMEDLGQPVVQQVVQLTLTLTLQWN